MSETRSQKQLLESIHKKLTDNLTNVRANLADASARAAQADEETFAAAKTLLDKFGGPQGTVQVLQSIAQVSHLTDTEAEITEMITSVEDRLRIEFPEDPAPPEQ